MIHHKFHVAVCRMVVILGDYKFTIMMIKSSYTGNKKEIFFIGYKFHGYKITRFRDGDGTCQWIYNGAELLRKCSDKIIELTYKQMFFKSLDAVNYDLKGLTISITLSNRRSISHSHI